jgi:hypothetical protein
MIFVEKTGQRRKTRRNEERERGKKARNGAKKRGKSEKKLGDDIFFSLIMSENKKKVKEK